MQLLRKELDVFKESAAQEDIEEETATKVKVLVEEIERRHLERRRIFLANLLQRYIFIEKGDIVS